MLSFAFGKDVSSVESSIASIVLLSFPDESFWNFPHILLPLFTVSVILLIHDDPRDTFALCVAYYHSFFSSK